MQIQIQNPGFVLPVAIISTILLQNLQLVNAVALNWAVQSTIVFGKEVELRCTVTGTTCCRGSSRSWQRGPMNTQIMFDGTPEVGYTTLFREKMDEAAGYFSLIINSVQLSDLGMVYTCIYGVTTDAKALDQTNTSEWHTSSSEKSSINADHLIKFMYYSLQRSAVITKIAPEPTISAKFGEKVLAFQSTIQKYDTWFYNITLTLNEDFSPLGFCSRETMLQVTVKAGQYSFDILHEDVCDCLSCIWKSILCTLIAAVIAEIVLVFWLKWFKEFKFSRLLLLLGVSCLICLIPALVGYLSCTCIGLSHWMWILFGVETTVLGMGFAYKIAIRKHNNDGKAPWFIILCIITLGLMYLQYRMFKWIDKDTLNDEENIEKALGEYKSSSSVPTVQIKKKQYVVRPGMTETLECTFNSTSPVTQVFWERTNDGTKTIIPNTTDQEKNLGSTPRIPSLTIRDIEKSDAGTYRCVATNRDRKSVV